MPPYPLFPTALQVGPFYSIFPHNFYGFKSVYYFQTFLLFHGDFFQFQFGFRTRRTDNMIVSRIFIATAIILPYVLSFPLENDLSVSVKYLEQLENRIHNLEAPGMYINDKNSWTMKFGRFQIFAYICLCSVLFQYGRSQKMNRDGKCVMKTKFATVILAVSMLLVKSMDA